MKFTRVIKHYTYPVQTWSTEEGVILERVRRAGTPSCRFDWYLNGSKVDGFEASQLLKDSH